MKNLIEAITIMSKYSDDEFPINCEHDILRFNKVDTTKVSKEDIDRLEELSFHDDRDDIGGFYSFKYGSN